MSSWLVCTLVEESPHTHTHRQKNGHFFEVSFFFSVFEREGKGENALLADVHLFSLKKSLFFLLNWWDQISFLPSSSSFHGWKESLIREAVTKKKWKCPNYSPLRGRFGNLSMLKCQSHLFFHHESGGEGWKYKIVHGIQQDDTTHMVGHSFLSLSLSPSRSHHYTISHHLLLLLQLGAVPVLFLSSIWVKECYSPFFFFFLPHTFTL